MFEKKKYTLYSKERRYCENTLVSFYFKSNDEIKKKYRPIDIDGFRYRLNNDTGEVKNYKRAQCEESKKASIRRTRIAMNMLLEMNNFDWFWTLTFDQQKIERTNAKVVFECYEKYVSNLRKQYPNFKYMTFPERHKDGCFHFHLLTSGLTVKQMGLVNSGKVCCSWAKEKYNGVVSKAFFERTKQFHVLKETDGEPVYNATSFAYGFTTVSKICSPERCKTYVKKYVYKALGSTEDFRKRFFYSSNLNVPEIVKRIIGADFDSPTPLDKSYLMQQNPFVKHSSYQQITEHNVLQIQIDNTTKDNIEKGLLPCSQKEINEMERIF